MNPYRNSLLWDYFYRNACIAYTTKVGIPDPEIRDHWIKNEVQEDYEYYLNQTPIIQELLESYKTSRLNEEKQQTLH